MPALESRIEGLANPLRSPSFLLRPLDGAEVARGDELTSDGQRHLLVEPVEFRRMRGPGFRLLVLVCVWPKIRRQLELESR